MSQGRGESRAASHTMVECSQQMKATLGDAACKGSQQPRTESGGAQRPVSSSSHSWAADPSLMRGRIGGAERGGEEEGKRREESRRKGEGKGRRRQCEWGVDRGEGERKAVPEQDWKACGCPGLHHSDLDLKHNC